MRLLKVFDIIDDLTQLVLDILADLCVIHTVSIKNADIIKLIRTPKTI